jgi:WD40 repeat protein
MGESGLLLQVVAKFKAHSQNVRWLDYDPNRNLLISCSFDKTVKIFSAEKQ